MNPSQVQQLSDEKLDRWEEQLQQLNEQLTNAAVIDRPRIPERYFAGLFLPFFAGDAERAYPQVNLVMWVNRVAGNPYHEVDVIDRDGQVLFTVPPVFDRRAVDPQKSVQSNATPVSHVVASAQQYTNLSPAMGDQYIRSELTKRALVMRVPANVLAHVESWNQIFARYGRPPLVELDLPSESKDSAAKEAGSPDPGFEMGLL